MMSSAVESPKPVRGRLAPLRATVSDHRVTVVCLLVFVVSRAAYYAAGVRFDLSDLGRQWQTIDLDVLRADYWNSIWQAHTVPPLYNASIGAALKWSPVSLGTTFWVVNLLLGVVLTLALARLLRNLGVSRVGIVVTVAVIVANPATVLFENWLFYEYPVAVGLVVIVCAFTELVRNPRLGPVIVIVGVAAIITLTRSLFHPLWFAVIVALAVGIAFKVLDTRRTRRGVLLAAAIPVAVVGLALVRSNQISGSPSLSSWSGMNLSRIAMVGVPGDVRAQWVADGAPSSLTSGSFLPYESYRPQYPPCQPDASGPDVLSAPVKSSGTSNFNYECYLPVYDNFLSGSIESIRREPTAYLRNVVDAWQISLRRADTGTPPENRARISSAYDAWGTFGLVQVDTSIAFPFPADAPDPLPRKGQHSSIPISLTFVFTVLLVFAAGARALVRWLRDGITPTRVALTLVAFLVAWTLVIGNATELPENNRFRFLVEPLLFVVLGLAIDRAIAWVRNQRRPDTNSSSAPSSVSRLTEPREP